MIVSTLPYLALVKNLASRGLLQCYHDMRCLILRFCSRADWPALAPKALSLGPVCWNLRLFSCGVLCSSRTASYKNHFSEYPFLSQRLLQTRHVRKAGPGLSNWATGLAPSICASNSTAMPRSFGSGRSVTALFPYRAWKFGPNHRSATAALASAVLVLEVAAWVCHSHDSHGVLSSPGVEVRLLVG